jgi:hypothetical protein
MAQTIAGRGCLVLGTDLNCSESGVQTIGGPKAPDMLDCVEFSCIFNQAIGPQSLSLGKLAPYKFGDHWIPVPLPPPRTKYLISMMFLSLDDGEFLRTFRGFAARAATALFAQRRIFRRLQAFATARLNCAFAVVRRSLAVLAFL